ncbi:hypothetical protein PTI98_011865 [Pleurotus ostreatus]|nr:hypothetical protein PTI98_011865 [Pleurotus ostreatus]
MSKEALPLPEPGDVEEWNANRNSPSDAFGRDRAFRINGRISLGVCPPVHLDEELFAKTHLLVGFSPDTRKEWDTAYKADPYFREKLQRSSKESPDTLLTPSRFQKGVNGLLYFVDADWNYRLCVPRDQIPAILKMIHDSPHESAHEGA